MLRTSNTPFSWFFLPFIILSYVLSLLWTVVKLIIPWKGARTQSQHLFLSGERPPRFFEGTYAQATAKAREEYKFLLLYLHSSIHSDTPRFCSEVLCTEVVASFLEENFIIWGSDVSCTEAYRLSSQFKVTTYPFFAVLTHVSNSSTMAGYLQSLNYNKRFTRSGITLLYRKQGYISGPDLMQALTDTLETHGALLEAARSERVERERDRNLVELQDREFQESERRDREREQQLLEEQNRQRQEEEQKLREEREKEENRKREEKEREEKRRREEELRIEKERRLEEQSRAVLLSLPPEPESGSNTTQLLIRLSDGTRIQRRFLMSDPLEQVYAFVATKEIIDGKVITTHYPKKIFIDQKMSLQEASLCPSASIFVEDLV